MTVSATFSHRYSTEFINIYIIQNSLVNYLIFMFLQFKSSSQKSGTWILYTEYPNKRVVICDYCKFHAIYVLSKIFASPHNVNIFFLYWGIIPSALFKVAYATGRSFPRDCDLEQLQWCHYMHLWFEQMVLYNLDFVVMTLSLIIIDY